MKKHWLVVSLFVLMSVTIYAAVGVIIFFGNKDNVNAAGKTVATMSTYVVTFKLNGGKFTDDTRPSDRVASGSTIKKPQDPFFKYYHFDGWYDNRDYQGEPFNFTTKITSNITLYAKWTRISYGVTFDDGLNGPKEYKVKINQKVDFELATWNGYTVLGWYTDRELQNEFKFDDDNMSISKITEDITLYAKWPLAFEQNEDHTYSIVDYKDNGSLTEIVIPATYRGKAVTTIADHAFKNCTTIEQVTFEEGITIIDDNAFEGCTALTSVELPSSLTSIGQSAFADCINLNSIVIPRNVTSMGKYVFADCHTLMLINCEANREDVNWTKDWKKRCDATEHWGYIK